MTARAFTLVIVALDFLVVAAQLPATSCGGDARYHNTEDARTIRLEESETAVLTRIARVTTSPNGQCMAIVDRANGQVLLYECATGRLLRAKDVEAKWSDSIAGALKSAHPNAGYLRANEISATAGERGATRYGEGPLRNTFENCSFESDTTLLLIGYVRVLKYPVKGRPRQVDIIVALFRYYTNSDRLVYIPIRRPDGVPQPLGRALEYDPVDRTVIIGCADFEAAARGDHARAWILSEYDINGSWLRNLTRIPDQHFRSGLGYNGFGLATVTGESGTHVILSNVPAILDVRRGTAIGISAYTHANDDFFRATKIVGPDSLGRLQRAFFKGLAVRQKGGYAVYARFRDSAQGNLRWLAIYVGKDGTPEGADVIKEYAGEVIEHIAFESHSQCMLVFYSSEVGWRVRSLPVRK